MYLRKLSLWNFRKYGSGNDTLDLQRPDLVVPFKPGLNVLIGENDSGKTAIIDSIKLVLKTHSAEWIPLDDEDFYDNSRRLRIECEFFDFSNEEAKFFTEWLGWEGTGNDAKPLLKVFIDARRTERGIIPPDIKAGLDEDGISLHAEAREYLRTTYLKPLRDAKAELVPRRNSRLSQILRAHPAFRKDPANHYLVKRFELFNAAIEKYFEGKDTDGGVLSVDQLGKELKDEIDRYLSEFSNKASQFEVTPADLKQILERLELIFKNEKNLGLGSHNILFVSAELLHLNKKEWHGLRLGLVEEIEAHLHPQIQLQVIESLHAIKAIQLIITTHSPNIGSKVDLEKLLICSGNKVFPMGKGYTCLTDPDYGYLRRFLDVTKANLFFAKGVILVEGWAEELILPSLAKKLGIDLTKKGVSVVNIGNTAFLRFSSVFRRKDNDQFEIPVAVITDLDIQPSDENDLVNGETRKARKLREKQGKYNGGCVRTFVSPHWTFEYCLSLCLSFREHFYEAIRRAGLEMTADGYSGKNVDDDWTRFASGKSDIAIAEEIYTQLVSGGRRISKAIIAQHFANILDSLPESDINKSDVEQDPNVNYLIEAIRYASRNN